MFCLPQRIEGYAAEVFDQLASDNHLRGRDHDGFVDGLADLWSDVNALHPFREGNGRSTRAFLAQPADDAGYHVAWNGLDPDRNNAAAIEGLYGDNAPMRALLSELVGSSLVAEPILQDAHLAGEIEPQSEPVVTGALERGSLEWTRAEIRRQQEEALQRQAERTAGRVM
jgi:fido (protein-threonine AMPylation protein)